MIWRWQQRFAEAQKWFHLVFDPTSTDTTVPPPERFWKSFVFRNDSAGMGIPREDKMARLNFFSGNWEFFGAPVGLIFTIDRQMQQGQWADLGMFMQSIMLLAREHGLHTCPQEAWALFHPQIREYLSVPENEMIFCGALSSTTVKSSGLSPVTSAPVFLSRTTTFVSTMLAFTCST